MEIRTGVRAGDGVPETFSDDANVFYKTGTDSN